MASIVEFDIHGSFPSIGFPEGTALQLIGYWGSGPLRLFTRAEVPEVALLGSAHKALPEFVAITAKLAVSAEVRTLIEALEPGRHQFFAVTIKRKKGNLPILRRDGTVLDTPYYLFNSTERLDAVLIEKSVVEVKTYKTGLCTVNASLQDKPKTVLRRAVIEGHHVWTGQYQLGGDMFFSDTLTQAVLDRKWKGLKFTPLKEE